MTIERENYLSKINIIIDEYLNTPEYLRSLTKLSKKYNIRRQTIAKYLRERGIPIVNYQNLCRITPNVFDVIDTEEKAYWLGFLYADGNISSKGHRLEVNLSAKDLNHMLKLKKFLNLETEIKIYDNSVRGNQFCRLHVRNTQLWAALLEKGCTPCKSLTLKFPDISVFSHTSLIRHFIRGYCDGDGSLGIYPERNTLKCNISMVGTEAFLNVVRNILGIPGYIRNKSCTNYSNKAFNLSYTGVNARKIARILYENSNIYLDRKYEIFENFCRFEEQSSRRKSSKIGGDWDVNPEVISEIAKGSETP